MNRIDLRYGNAGLTMLGLGYGSVVLGGLVAAVTDPLDLARGSWLAAYLVLVGGVAQIIFGWVPGTLGNPVRSWAQVVLWNVGNLVVIAATLAERPIGVVVGSVLLVAALLIALRGWWHWREGGVDRGTWGRILTWAYVSLLVLLAVSIPVGIALSLLRHG